MGGALRGRKRGWGDEQSEFLATIRLGNYAVLKRHRPPRSSPPACFLVADGPWHMHVCRALLLPPRSPRPHRPPRRLGQ